MLENSGTNMYLIFQQWGNAAIDINLIAENQLRPRALTAID